MTTNYIYLCIETSFKFKNISRILALGTIATGTIVGGTAALRMRKKLAAAVNK
jgi:hypothetical protein